MNRLAAFACCALLLACQKEEDIPIGTGGPITGTGSGGGAGGGGGSSADASTPDSGTADAGSLQACDPKVLPSPCPGGSYCACALLADGPPLCACYSGNLTDPCATGAAQCKAPGTCRWTSGSFWGRCGSVPGVAGDVCSAGSFFCAVGLSCLPCAVDRCCVASG